ncbi:MAG: hypothetical protein WBA74_10885 [Cyclobacteriaceae bacterium]
MSLSAGDMDLLDGYLRGELTASQEAQVEEKIHRDLDWQEAYAFHQDLEKAFMYTEGMQMKNFLRTTESGSADRISWLWAACLFLAVIAGALFWVADQPDSETLFQSYYEPYPNIVQPLNRANDTRELAFRYYDTQQYQKALQYFSNSDETVALFYAAQCYLALANTEKAKENFEKLTTRSSPYQVAATWYLGLGYVKTGHHAKAVEQFLKIENEVGYRQKVQQLVKALE